MKTWESDMTDECHWEDEMGGEVFETPDGKGTVTLDQERQRVNIEHEYGEVEIDGQEMEVEVKMDGFGELEMNGEEEYVQGRVDGVAKFEMQGNKIVITMDSATKLMTGASAALALLALQ